MTSRDNEGTMKGQVYNVFIASMGVSYSVMTGEY